MRGRGCGPRDGSADEFSLLFVLLFLFFFFFPFFSDRLFLAKATLTHCYVVGAMVRHDLVHTVPSFVPALSVASSP